ncbi:hypothetical protein GCM10007320_34890 [Pseudorhodoferax aquiterrae]|uniref:Uncharacterized protein n=1 Tax=Pseudorhodoferax aquiterrae TaxID=747304 RepID=A0ABQ3G4U0_9BURK|nr:hypothetical protein [Pseudorhodoferax aquiterrae]GHC88060.1 hypothetical protein GCM10007320_34890 [Pseudorhodoferax aquiterrae]
MGETALELARRHVVDGSRLVDEQNALIARLDPQGGQVGAAQELLATLKATLAIFVADLERLEGRGAHGRR